MSNPEGRKPEPDITALHALYPQFSRMKVRQMAARAGSGGAVEGARKLLGLSEDTRNLLMLPDRMTSPAKEWRKGGLAIRGMTKQRRKRDADGRWVVRGA